MALLKHAEAIESFTPVTVSVQIALNPKVGSFDDFRRLYDEFLVTAAENYEVSLTDEEWATLLWEKSTLTRNLVQSIKCVEEISDYLEKLPSEFLAELLPTKSQPLQIHAGDSSLSSLESSSRNWQFMSHRELFSSPDLFCDTQIMLLNSEHSTPQSSEHSLSALTESPSSDSTGNFLYESPYISPLSNELARTPKVPPILEAPTKYYSLFPTTSPSFGAAYFDTENTALQPIEKTLDAGDKRSALSSISSSQINEAPQLPRENEKRL